MLAIAAVVALLAYRAITSTSQIYYPHARHWVGTLADGKTCRTSPDGTLVTNQGEIPGVEGVNLIVGKVLRTLSTDTEEVSVDEVTFVWAKGKVEIYALPGYTCTMEEP